MLRFAACTAALLAAALPTFASADTGYYHATLEKPARTQNVVMSEVVWQVHDTSADAPRAGDIDKRVCAVLAQQLGKVVDFSAGGKALSADDMAYCNKHARVIK